MKNTIDGNNPAPITEEMPDLSEMARVVLPELRRMIREKQERENGNR